MILLAMPGQGTLNLLIITVFVTAVGVLVVTTYGNLLLAGLSKPFTYAGERLYRWFAPRIPIFIPVLTYRKHVCRSKLGYMENPVGPDIAVPLERAFAPLRLISSDQEHGVELFSFAADNDRFILLGGPGTGKTTLMKNLVINALNRVTHTRLDQLTPVFVELRHLATAKHAIEQAIIDAFDRYHFPGADKFVQAAISQGKLLIILDGLDEVGVNQSFVAEQIRTFCDKDNQQESKNSVIVTCRENSYRTEDLRAAIPTVVRVEPFSNHHMRRFLQGWPTYQERTAIRLYPDIQRDPQIRDVCKNPLMLTILTGLYLETPTENFEVPATRDKFYTAVIDEYLAKRPERKGLIQNFYPEAKKQTLERSSLERLEIVDPSEDPEELDVKVITRHANAAIQGDFDRRELIKELVETNGVLKPVADGSYIFVHRTIQEYLAASEALRIRTTEDVLEHFGARQELSEVLNFYCGLIRNVPQSTLVLKHFSDPDEWLRAGQCLLHMMEVPSAGQVYEISQSLFKTIERRGEYRQELEVLSSLAQRQSSVFEPAKSLFSEAVHLLTQGEEGSGTSALESVLAANPEMAVTIIPALRAHGSEELRRAGVRLLRNVETEGALDQLIQFLGGPDGPEKSQAAWVISDLVATRKDELIERASLLPREKNVAIWPLENYLPSRLAIPVARALSPEVETGNPAINLAAMAVRELKTRASGDTRFLRQWRNVLRDFRLANIRTVFASALMNISRWSLVVGIAAVILTATWESATDQTFVLQFDPLVAQPISNASLSAVTLEATNLRKLIEDTYPPNARGIARLLPQNWKVEPQLPPDTEEQHELIGKLSPNPWSLSRLEGEKLTLTLIHPEETSLRRALETFNAEPGPTGRYYIAIASIPLWQILLSTLMVLVVLLYSSYLDWRRVLPADRNFTFYSNALALITVFVFNVSLATLMGSWPLRLAFPILASGLFLCGLALSSVQWPGNRYTHIVQELI